MIYNRAQFELPVNALEFEVTVVGSCIHIISRNDARSRRVGGWETERGEIEELERVLGPKLTEP